MNEKTQARVQRVPRAAAWLGGCGVVPFLAFAAGLLIHRSDLVDFAQRGLLTYGAVILSFLGGILWGLGMAHGVRGSSWLRLGWAVLPSLAAWTALLLPGSAAFALLAVAFMVVLAGDALLHARGLVPSWYLRLRWPLTVLVTLCLLLAAATGG